MIFYDDDTKVKDLTVSQLRDLIMECIMKCKEPVNTFGNIPPGAIPLSQLLNPSKPQEEKIDPYC